MDFEKSHIQPLKWVILVSGKTNTDDVENIEEVFRLLKEVPR